MSGLLGTVRRAGLFDPVRVGAAGAALARWGPTLAGLYGAAAIRHPQRAAVVDHRGSLSFSRLDRRSTALAKGLRSLGIAPRDHLGVLCRNHRDFVEVTVAAAKASLVPVYLNTGFAGPQLADVAQRENVVGLVVDEAFLPVVDASAFDGEVVVADGDTGQTLHDVRQRSSRVFLRPPRPVAPVLLTSGTTGTPKGARRPDRIDPRSAVSLFEEIPYRVGDVFVIPTPLFHAWGLAQLALAATLGSTAVLQRSFEANDLVALISTEDATVLAVVPAMLQRLLSSGALDHAELGSLRIVASSGSALPAAVAAEWMDRVGDTLYNVYGSTEVGQATLATPVDLRAAPGTAGRVLPGSTVRILDGAGAVLPAGDVGRIFVGSGAQFTGYTGGGGKEAVDGLLSSGDMGYFDGEGRLFITGRDDDMIVSGGENVFPAEIEDVLLRHPDITEVAVVGVPDDDFGQRLAAFVVVRPGATFDAESARTFVADHLARHKVPRDVEVVAELPRTTTGKVIRRDLTG